MALRRVLANRLRRQYGNSWPIHEPASRTPDGWPGWPGGKQFAFVLTHDVEGARGLERCRKLAEMDKALGFRASFNFVPEGEYRLPESLRTLLEQDGFEVGVHDLHHDGSLYRSSRTFKDQSQKINQHLQSWGAVGFRSGFMFHNLQWIQGLNILYDTSTFDIDPFVEITAWIGLLDDSSQSFSFSLRAYSSQHSKQRVRMSIVGSCS